MNILALLQFTAFLLYVWLIIVVISRAPKSRLNQAFVLFTACWAVATFGTAFMTAAPDKSSAVLWSKIAGVGFCSFPPFLLRFFLIYTNKERTPGNRIFSLVMFSIPPILYYNVWQGNLVADVVPAMFHSWQYVWSKSIWPYVFLVYEIISGFAGLWVTFRFGQKTELSHKKKQARIMVVAGIITMIIGVASDEILARFNISLPPLGSISTLIWAGAIAYAMAKYNLMMVTPATAGEDILSTMIDSLILVNPEGKIIKANTATANLLGYTNKEIIDQPIGILFAEEEEEEEDMPFKGAKLKKLIKEGSIKDYDMTYRAKSGEKIPVSFSGSVMRDKDGNLVGIVGVARDMREIKRLVEKEKKRVAELDTACRELEKSQNASLNIMERSDRQRKELDKAYNELKSADEALRENKAHLEEKIAERTLVLNEKYNELVQSQTAMLYMVEDLNRQGKELKEAQERIVRSEKLAVIGLLASSVAHELRNPLGVMKNAIYYLNMLELGKDNPDIKENLGMISAEIENSDKVISDLLQFSRIKQPDLKSEEINLIIKETLNRVTVPAGIKVVAELGKNLPPIQADALQMQQVFYNLAANAIQAMEKGGVLTVSSCLTHDKNIAIAFKDTGCGIPRENLQKIFEPLFSTKTKGTGLGLSVVASLVEGHGGKIEIESEAGKGSIFTVKLPIR